MKVIRFLIDKISVILLYVFVLVSGLIYIRVEEGSAYVLYITLAFGVYMVYEYIRYNSKVKRVQQQIDQIKQAGDIIDVELPIDGEYEQVIHELLEEYHKRIREIKTVQYRERKSYEDYIDGWIHEIKTPIAALKLINEGIELTDVDEEITKLNNLVNQVLYYTKVGNVHKDYTVRDVDIENIVGEVIRSSKITFIKKKIKISLDIEHGLVKSDKKWLEFIINQIVVNALKYTKVGGEIKIFTSKVGDRTYLHIRDNGIGIPKDDLPRVFEKGFTGANGRVGSKSTGVGLFIVNNLVNQLGHRINIKSNKNEYTEVILGFSEFKVLD